jgi:ABC-type transport system involved in multi-copper enzyme maturation permease subunit
MPVLPVISREMRASARQPFTFHLRTLGAGTLILTSLVFGLFYGFRPDMGEKLFGALHASLFIAIWILVPLLTADCLSRERREGTLGLLFLTPLRPGELVVAKGFANGLRALSLLFAVIPILTIPLLLGGTSWMEALLSVAANLSAIAWALAAGLLASAWSKALLRALFCALALSMLFLVALCIIVGQLMMFAFRAPSVVWPQYTSDFAFLEGAGVLGNSGGMWALYSRLGSTSQFLWVGGQFFLISLLGLAIVIGFAGRKIRRSWREEPPSARQQWMTGTFCTPVIGVAFLRRFMRRKLERNPIGWLEQRTWTGRLVTWGWLALMVSFYTAIFTERSFAAVYFYLTAQQLMAWLLLGGMILSASGSFRRERETGVLELLLVSPIGESRIIAGRLAGLWSQFLPAFGLLIVLWVYLCSLFPDRSNCAVIPFYAISFLTLPVIGLYYSLLSRSFLTAFLSTTAVGLVVPLVVPPLFGLFGLLGSWSYSNYSWTLKPSGKTSLVQVILALFCWFRLHSRLKQRAFSLDKSGP